MFTLDIIDKRLSTLGLSPEESKQVLEDVYEIILQRFIRRSLGELTADEHEKLSHFKASEIEQFVKNKKSAGELAPVSALDLEDIHNTTWEEYFQHMESN